MNERLPLKINPFELCDRQVILEGQLPLKELPRIVPLIENPEAVVGVHLTFSHEENGLRCIKGWVKANLMLICQRCDYPMSYDINVRPCLSPVVDDVEAKRLPKICEPVLVTDEKIVVAADLVEEELLLSLPMIPKHEQGECPIINVGVEKNGSTKKS